MNDVMSCSPLAGSIVGGLAGEIDGLVSGQAVRRR